MSVESFYLKMAFKPHYSNFGKKQFLADTMQKYIDKKWMYKAEAKEKGLSNPWKSQNKICKSYGPSPSTVSKWITRKVIWTGSQLVGTWCCNIGQNDTIGKIELIPLSVLSSENTSYKNDIQLFLQLFDEHIVNGDYH